MNRLFSLLFIFVFMFFLTSCTKSVDKRTEISFSTWGSRSEIQTVKALIDEFEKHEELIMFISKNLSLGVFGDSLTNLLHRDSLGILEIFKKEIEDNNLNIKNPEITIFMIIELTSSVVFSSITMGKPMPIEDLKPVLYDKIRKLLID